MMPEGDSFPRFRAREVVPDGRTAGSSASGFSAGPGPVNLPHVWLSSVGSSSILLLIRCVTKDRQKFLITKSLLFFPSSYSDSQD